VTNVTTWVENPEGGRARGPRGLARAWVEVLVRPRRFFRNGVAPGDQAPGLTFAVVVAVGFAVTLIAVEPATVPTAFGSRAGSIVVALAATALLLAPAALHLAAALQTVLLVITSLRVRATLTTLSSDEGFALHSLDRAGVSRTVQVIAYATGPCVLAGVPLPAVRAACAVYGGYLLTLGIHEVHGFGPGRAMVAALVPGAFVFGVAFRGFDAAASLLTQLSVI
jgi:hypothetical protein